MSQTSIEIHVGPTSHFTLSLKDASLSVQKTLREFVTFVSRRYFEKAVSESKPTSHDEIEHRYILRAQFKEETRSLSLAYLAKKNKTPLSLVVIEGGVEESAINRAKAWVEALMKAVYDGTLGSPFCKLQVLIFSDIGLKRSRRFMVFVNPFGGTVGAYPTTKQVHPNLPSFYLEKRRGYIRKQG